MRLLTTCLALLVGTLASSAQSVCQQARLPQPPDSVEFGSVVATDGQWVFVSDLRREVDGLVNAGAVHLYRWDGVAWIPSGVLESPTASENAFFGRVLSAGGGRLAVAELDLVSVFRREGTSWVLEDSLPLVSFTTSSTIGPVLLAEDELFLGPGGTGQDFVDRWRRDDASGWSFQGPVVPQPEATLPSVTNQFFGTNKQSIVRVGELLIVADLGADVGSNVDQGLLYFYGRDADGWDQLGVLEAPVPGAGQFFGTRIDARPGRLFVAESVSPRAVHAYDLVGAQPALVDTFGAAPGLSSNFGNRDVHAIGADRVVVPSGTTDGVFQSALYVQDQATGEFGYVGSLVSEDAAPMDGLERGGAGGNVYVAGPDFYSTLPERPVAVFRVPGADPIDLGGGVAGSSGEVPSFGTSCPAVELELELFVAAGPPDSVGALAISHGPTLGVPLPSGGVLHPLVPGLALWPVALDGSGEATIPVGLVPAGHFVCQCGFLDPGAAGGIALTDGLALILESPFTL